MANRTAMRNSDVRQFLNSLLQDSTRAMAKKCPTSLRSIISCAQEHGYVQHNVARDVKPRRSERHDAGRVFPAKDEIKALISNAPERHKPLIVTGDSRSDLGAIGLERSIISIRERAELEAERGGDQMARRSISTSRSPAR